MGVHEDQVRSVEAELRRTVDGEVRFDRGSRAIYSTDSSNYRQLPIGVVVPRNADDVAAAVEACHRHGVPILPRGAGTSLAGQCCNAAVVIDCSKYFNRVLEIDRDRCLARVEPGAILDDLRRQAEGGTPSLTFGPDPATHDECTIGGMLGNNSCGTHSVMAEFYGRGSRMADNVAGMEVLTYDGLRMRVGPTPDVNLHRHIEEGGRRGDVYRRLRALRDRYATLIRERYPHIPRRVSGYNLDDLLPEGGFDVAAALTGTEGTCVTVLEATLHLIDCPPARTAVLLGFEDIYAAAAFVPEARAHRPIAIEGFDRELVNANVKRGAHLEELGLLPDGHGWLIVEFGGQTRRESDAAALKIAAAASRAPGHTGHRLYKDAESAARMWRVRESALAATAFVPGMADTREGWEDSAVPPDRLADYLRSLRGLLDSYRYAGALYGHFGQGCVHTRIDFDLLSVAGVERFRRFLDEASDLVLAHGGSLSGEHGDGQARGELLPKMYGLDLVEAFREFKSIWDPEWKMNPGKVVDPRPITADLRLSPSYSPPAVATHFSYPQDHGSFAHATQRCVGVGRCRRLGGGTMCPSFMVTREEEHTTRGRARALFEMMSGSGEVGSWRSREVFDALELCLSCKACKAECPVSVDMATYKAEFMSHHYRGRLRPRAAYALGLIPWWARLGSRAPRLANLLTSAPGLSPLVKRAAGVAPERLAPRLAERTFIDWFGDRPTTSGRGSRVLLWPDTFTNFFHPEVGVATVEVLEAAGCRVGVPSAPLCCGRPLYDYGMLDTAQRWLRRILNALRPEIRAGTPVVGMEPSCVAVFRDELPNLFPGDGDAARLSEQSYVLSEFLMKLPGWWPPALAGRRALVQRHCHHASVMGFDAERDVFERLGLEAELLDSGCCGMAGSFGFEAGRKYDVSIRAGERVLFPAVRRASPETIVLADGFSCRTQIEQGTGRRALHLAQAIRMAMREPEATIPGPG